MLDIKEYSIKPANLPHWLNAKYHENMRDIYSYAREAKDLNLVLATLNHEREPNESMREHFMNLTEIDNDGFNYLANQISTHQIRLEASTKHCLPDKAELRHS